MNTVLIKQDPVMVGNHKDEPPDPEDFILHDSLPLFDQRLVCYDLDLAIFKFLIYLNYIQIRRSTKKYMLFILYSETSLPYDFPNFLLW